MGSFAFWIVESGIVKGRSDRKGGARSSRAEQHATTFSFTLIEVHISDRAWYFALFTLVLVRGVVFWSPVVVAGVRDVVAWSRSTRSRIESYWRPAAIEFEPQLWIRDVPRGAAYWNKLNRRQWIWSRSANQ